MFQRGRDQLMGDGGWIQVAFRERNILGNENPSQVIFFNFIFFWTTKGKGKRNRWPSLDKAYSSARTILM